MKDHRIFEGVIATLVTLMALKKESDCKEACKNVVLEVTEMQLVD